MLMRTIVLRWKAKFRKLSFVREVEKRIVHKDLYFLC